MITDARLIELIALWEPPLQSLEVTPEKPFEDFLFLEPGEDFFVVPDGAISAQISVIGGGGGAGMYTEGPGGGGGSGYITHSERIEVTPRRTWEISVGAGGSAGNTKKGENGIAGESSTVSGIGIDEYIAKGGQGGYSGGQVFWGRGGHGGHGGGGGGQHKASSGGSGKGYNTMPGYVNTPEEFQVYARRTGGGSYGNVDGMLDDLNTESNLGGASKAGDEMLYLLRDASIGYYVGKGGDGGRSDPQEAWSNMGYGGNGGYPVGMTGIPRGTGGDAANYPNTIGMDGTDGAVIIRVFYVDE